ncbi:DUF1818 family protein [Microcoleus sp. Pol14C6]|uniref:DUF1818 family protein n=1 Tax=unclassified Microcoleus TaxID=2642155 RepID=UPI002FD03BA3
MVERIIKTGSGWRLGWNPEVEEFQGLVAGDGWAIELTEAELNDFCRLLGQLAGTMSQMASELMDEEKIAIEAESDLLWVQVEGYPEAYSVQLILNAGRRCEGFWPAAAVRTLVQAAKVLKVF